MFTVAPSVIDSGAADGIMAELPRLHTGKQQRGPEKIVFVTNTIPDSSITVAKLRHSL